MIHTLAHGGLTEDSHTHSLRTHTGKGREGNRKGREGPLPTLIRNLSKSLFNFFYSTPIPNDKFLNVRASIGGLGK